MLKLQSEIKELAEIFAPLSPLYLVGGAVRNSILGLELSDYDIASSATSSEVKDLLSGTRFLITAEYPRTGTLLISSGIEKYEFTTFREDSYPINSGGHMPAKVKFTQDMKVDALRRDFSCNALYYDIKADTLIDLVNGVADIENATIRTVNSGDITLAEDSLRIMRLVRFCHQLGFKPSAETMQSAKKYSSRLADISAERVHDELIAILNAPDKYNTRWSDGKKVLPSDGIRMLVDIGAMEFIIPEILEGVGLEQNSKYHIYDVYNHILKTVDNCPVHLRLAGLFHDIAKPMLAKKTGMMYGHDIAGEKMTRQIMTRLKFSVASIEHTCKLVSMHMFNLDNNVKTEKLRLFIADNYEYIDDYLLLRKADGRASKCDKISQEVINRTYEVMREMKNAKVPILVTEMELRGGDLLREGYSGEEIGNMLSSLHREQVRAGVKFTREQLLKRIKRTVEN